jgi:hypothetical protein
LKDPADYYNVTVSMLVKRLPDEKSRAPARDPYGNVPKLRDLLDMGFPYDDGDNTINDQAPLWSKKANCGPTLVGRLNGQNVSKEALKNLVQDVESPIT